MNAIINFKSIYGGVLCKSKVTIFNLLAKSGED